MWTPNGTPLLFEAYYRYDVVTSRSSALWRAFSGIMLSSLAAVFVLLIPVAWALVQRGRRAQRQREAAMQHAVDASQDERRRIAGTLHDGVVQQLAAASFAIAGDAERAARRGELELAAGLRATAGTVRATMAGMRSLLVDLYPPSLRSGGLAPALRDLAGTVSGTAVQVSLDVDAALAEELAPEVQESVYRVAQECLRNAAKHAAAQTVAVRLSGHERGGAARGERRRRRLRPSLGDARAGRRPSGSGPARRCRPPRRGAPRGTQRARPRRGLPARRAPMTRVLLVDDHRLVRAGLAGLIDAAADLTVVGEAADGRQAIEVARATGPDVVLMDVSMPVLDGIAATRELLQERPELRIVALTSFADSAKVGDMLRAGAVGYLLKDCDPAQLLSAVRAAARGEAPLDPRAAVTLLPGRREDDPAAALSVREREVLQLTTKGLANKQIARALGISEQTVKVHLGNVFRRIGVADRTSAALWAREHLPAN